MENIDGPISGKEVHAALSRGGFVFRAEILGGDVWGAPNHKKHGGGAIDYNTDCRPSPQLGNAAGAEIREGDIWRALRSVPAVAV